MRQLGSCLSDLVFAVKLFFWLAGALNKLHTSGAVITTVLKAHAMHVLAEAHSLKSVGYGMVNDTPLS